ncbi:type VII secretion-associated protein [Nocardia veterana]|uniref:Type VII secretion-associated protein n=1 Tax=Nocardia veterana TaxID=132249 RepID=A0A7X6M2X3_9NOCA|nr:type VII secretion-associated protein [Nocardia veterana]NKY89192.1 type VII secretion-associated protein [Nocardia veterana]
MSTVDLILTDSRVWARSESTHWDGAPSVVPASDGTNLIVGEPLQPPSPAVSVVRLAAADRIAVVPMLPTPADAFAAVFGAVLTNLRLAEPCRKLTVVGPSEWGTRRRAALEAGARRLVADVAVEPLALRVAKLSASTSQQQRIAVVEANPLTTTVTLAGRSGTETWIEACEYEPTVGTADLAEGRGVAAVVDVVDRLLGGRKPTYFVVLGISDPGTVAAMREQLTQRYGFGVDLRTMSGVDLLRGGPAVPAATPPAQPATQWVGSLHQHAAASRPPTQRRKRLLLGAAASLGVILLAVAAALVLTRSGGTATTAAPTGAGATSAPAAPAQTFGRVRARVPRAWHGTLRSDNRADFVPDDGARERISLVQKSLPPGLAGDEVAAALTAQIAARPPGTVGPLRRDVVFGGRPGSSYEEYPGDGTTVRWQVLVDSGIQVSIGCQYPTGSWEPMATVCEKFVAELEIAR